MKLKSLLFIAAATFVMTAGSAIAQPINNDCANAIDIQSAIGNPVGQVDTLGPFDNTFATVDPTDPIVGFECFGEPDGGGSNPTIENTMWFTFVGDGGQYFIETGNAAVITNYIDDGDTQIALYEGTCSTLTPVGCNEDGPSATTSTYPAGITFTTTVGTVYKMMVDGFNFNGILSTGEYMLFISQLTPVSVIACGDTSVTPGIATAVDATVCNGDTLFVSTAGALSPNVGTTFGWSMIVSDTDISFSPDPLNQTGVLGGTGIVYPPAANQGTTLINDGGVFPAGIYYFTPVVYGNATGTGNVTALTLDPACTYTGQSLMVTLYAPGDPACTVGLNEVNNSGLSLSTYQVNENQMNLNIVSATSANVEVAVYDVSGRLVLAVPYSINSGANSHVLDVTNLGTGAYVIKLSDNNSVVTSKMVKY